MSVPEASSAAIIEEVRLCMNMIQGYHKRKSRVTPIVWAKHLARYMLYYYSTQCYTLADVARTMLNEDHSTINWSINKIKGEVLKGTVRGRTIRDFIQYFEAKHDQQAHEKSSESLSVGSKRGWPIIIRTAPDCTGNKITLLEEPQCVSRSYVLPNASVYRRRVGEKT